MIINTTAVTIPKLELIVCFSVWLFHSLGAFYKVYQLSLSLSHTGWLPPLILRPGRSFFNWLLQESTLRDGGNFEWDLWLSAIWRLVPCYVAHALFFRTGRKLLSERRFWGSSALFWFLCHIFTYGYTAVFQCIAYGLGFVFITNVASRLGCHYAVGLIWSFAFICLWLLIIADQPNATEHDNDQLWHLGVILAAHKLLQYVSYSLNIIKDQQLLSNTSVLQQCLELFRYSFYWPYHNFLVVPYHEFKTQLSRRDQMPEVNTVYVVCQVLRLLFWGFFAELLLHVVHMNAFLAHPHLLRTLPFWTLYAVVYTAGQFFHIKYTCIFGLPSIFARIDDMQPPGPPICISRVALFSNIWRYFDRGLYLFLKDHVYLPLVAPNYSFGRRLLGTTITFAFIFIWHGASPSYFWWILINLVEIFLETLAIQLWTIPNVQKFLVGRLSLLNIRRLVALCTPLCTLLGHVAICYFLADTQSKAGSIFALRVMERMKILQFSFWHLVILGYCYAQVCYQIDTTFGYVS